MKPIENVQKEQIIAFTKEIHLPGMRREYERLAMEALEKDYSYPMYLHSLLEQEQTLRMQNSKESKIRAAEFPYKKYLEDLVRTELPVDAAKKLPVLETLDFIKSGQNVILSGSPGTGKTHIAVGLGIRACQQNYRVLYVSTHSLITQLRESRSAKMLRAMEAKFARYDLLICDEFGYIGYDREGAELLFSQLSLRAGRKSVIITTNLSFERWSEIFGDPVVTAAMVDRLTHRAYLVNMNGESYRIKDTKKWMQLQSDK